MRHKYWTYERIKAEADKYDTRRAFYTNSLNAYSAACRHGVLKALCRHMKRFSKPPGYWSYKRVKREAMKYKTRGAFYRNAKSAYNAAYRNGYLDEICSHMTYCFTYDRQQKEDELRQAQMVPPRWRTYAAAEQMKGNR